MEKFESERNTLFSVILGFIPRIHAEQNLSRHYRACPDNLDPRVRPEDDNRRRMCFTPEDDRDLMVDTRDRLFVTPEYDGDLMVDTRVMPENDKCTIFKGLDVVRQCAALLERRVQSSTRVRKAQAVTRQTNPIGRSMIEMLGVLAIIGVLSVGGIAGYSKAMMQFKINKTLQGITEIITNIRTLYAQQKDFNGLYTDVAISTGIVPDYLSDQYGSVYLPVGGYIFMGPGYKYVTNGYNNNETFNMRIAYIPKEACIALATANWGSISSTGVAGIAVGDISESGALDYDITPNCNTQGVTQNYTDGYYACSGQRISPAIASQYCKDNSSYNNFTIKIVK